MKRIVKRRLIKCPRCEGSGRITVAVITPGQMIRDARRAQKMTQQMLADKVDLTRVTIANIELGNHDTSLKTLARIAKGLRCSMRDLVPL